MTAQEYKDLKLAGRMAFIPIADLVDDEKMREFDAVDKELEDGVHAA